MFGNVTAVLVGFSKKKFKHSDTLKVPHTFQEISFNW